MSVYQIVPKLYKWLFWPLTILSLVCTYQSKHFGMAKAKSLYMMGGLPIKSSVLEKFTPDTNNFDDGFRGSLVSLDNLNQFYWKTFWRTANLRQSTPYFNSAIKAIVCQTCFISENGKESKEGTLVNTKEFPYNGSIFGK